MHDSGESPDENFITDAALSDDFLTRRMKNQKKLEGITLYIKLGSHFFFFSEIQSAEVKVRERVVRATAKVWMKSDNLNVKQSIVGCSLYTAIEVSKPKLFKSVTEEKFRPFDSIQSNSKTTDIWNTLSTIRLLIL